jgi:hypothetical protein
MKLVTKGYGEHALQESGDFAFIDLYGMEVMPGSRM